MKLPPKHLVYQALKARSNQLTESPEKVETNKEPTLTYSAETLIHYNCSDCKGWFSIGDGPVWTEDGAPRALFCPWCGKQSAPHPK